MLRVSVMAILAVITPAAWVQAAECAPREKVVERLNSKFGETRRSMGLAPNNSVIEVFASEESGTFTITVTSPRGVTCLMASGQAFEKTIEALPKKGNQI